MDLTTPIEAIPRIGSTSAGKLHALGIRTASDLLWHVPFRYDDLSRIVPIGHVKIGETVTVRATVQSMQTVRLFHRRGTLTTALMSDATGSVQAVWFNQPYLTTTLHPGETVYLSGKAVLRKKALTFQAPSYEKEREVRLHTGRLVPIYPSTADLTQRQLRFFLSQVLPLADRVPDLLPEAVRARHALLPVAQALRGIHFPKDRTEGEQARRRLAFEELFCFSLGLLLVQHARKRAVAPRIPFDQKRTSAFVRQLPFPLTDDQRRAAWEILQDLERPYPMNRLLEGEVGSGKTVVATIAMHSIAGQGYQSVYLAPTDILAQQHYATVSALLKSDGVRVGLLTRTKTAWNAPGTPDRDRLLRAVHGGDIAILIGTHALLQKDLHFPKLALAIIDEQHRFGVRERRGLALKGGDAKPRLPHVLSMTATPIPRSLALTLFGDLDRSVILQLPKTRKPIATRVVAASDRQEVSDAIAVEIRKGRQAFVVCPIITESDVLGVKAATAEYETLRSSVFPIFRVGLIHGQQKPEQRDAVLEQFRAGTIDVLVTTAVIEVGIDVANATVMVIEGAERFGLAQLHQLRGRVGRGPHPSTCFLMAEAVEGQALERLAAVAKTQDGFALAEEDLRLRGPGELFGLHQSGFPQLRVAAITDVALIQESRTETQELLAQDPTLSTNPALRAAALTMLKSGIA